MNAKQQFDEFKATLNQPGELIETIRKAVAFLLQKGYTNGTKNSDKYLENSIVIISNSITAKAQQKLFQNDKNTETRINEQLAPKLAEQQELQDTLTALLKDIKAS